jgi:hypothetical protein
VLKHARPGNEGSQFLQLLRKLPAAFALFLRLEYKLAILCRASNDIVIRDLQRYMLSREESESLDILAEPYTLRVATLCQANRTAIRAAAKFVRLTRGPSLHLVIYAGDSADNDDPTYWVCSVCVPRHELDISQPHCNLCGVRRPDRVDERKKALVTALLATYFAQAISQNRNVSKLTLLHSDGKTDRVAGADDAGCAMCLDALSSSECMELPCGHVYHQSCVKELREFGVNDACPVCRAPPLTGPLTLLDDGTRLACSAKMTKDLRLQCRQYAEAAVLLQQALAEDSSLAQAHSVLGSVLEMGEANLMEQYRADIECD